MADKKKAREKDQILKLVNHIGDKDSYSLPDIQNATGLDYSTVVHIVQELIEDETVRARQITAKERYQKGVDYLVSPNAKGKYFLDKEGGYTKASKRKVDIRLVLMFVIALGAIGFWDQIKRWIQSLFMEGGI